MNALLLAFVTCFHSPTSMTAVILCKMWNILPDNSVVMDCISSFPILPAELEFILLSIGKYYSIFINIFYFYTKVCFPGHISWFLQTSRYSSFPFSSGYLLHLFICLPYLFPYLAIFHFDVFSIFFLPFTPFFYILSLSRSLSSLHFLSVVDWWPAIRASIKGLLISILFAFSLCGPLPLWLWLNNKAKEDDSKPEAKESLEKVFAHFHLLSWTPASTWECTLLVC